MAFDKVPKIKYEPVQQTPLDYSVPTTISGVQPSGIQEEKSLSTQIVENYSNTLSFFDWVIGQFDDKIKDVVVQVDPEQHPEVWMAMKRIFKDSANTNLSGTSYLAVVDALNEISKLEYQEATAEIQAPELEFIQSLEEPETEVNPIPFSGSTEDLAALEEATRSRTSVFTKDPPEKRPSVSDIMKSANIQRAVILTQDMYDKALARLKAEGGKNGHIEYIGGVKYLVWEK